MGEGRIGLRVTSVMALVPTVMRGPVWHIRALRCLLSGGEISVREILERLHRVNKHAEPVLAGSKEEIRARRAKRPARRWWRAWLHLVCLNSEAAF